jgi:hypothetical protein
VLGCNLFADAVRDVSGEAGRQLLSARAAKKVNRSERRSRARVTMTSGEYVG